MIDMIIVYILFAWALFITSNIFGDRWVNYISSTFLIVLGIFVFIYGIGLTNDWLTQAVGYVHFGIGLISLLVSAFADFKKKKENYYEF